MPQWLSLPSIQKSYGARTEAMRPVTRTSGFQMRSLHPLLRRLQVGEIFLVGKSAHIGLAVAYSHRVKPALRLKDLARALDVAGRHGVEECLHGLQHGLTFGIRGLRLCA